MSDSGQTNDGIRGKLVDAKEALEDYIQFRQHIGSEDVNLAAAALIDIQSALAMLVGSAPPRAAGPSQVDPALLSHIEWYLCDQQKAGDAKARGLWERLCNVLDSRRERTQADYDSERETQMAGSAPAEPLTERPVVTHGNRWHYANEPCGLCTLPAEQWKKSYLDALAALATQQAELNVLRGVHCEADGDGPCGVCLKCKERRWATQQAALFNARSLVKRLNDLLDRTQLYGPADALRDTAQALAKLLDAEPGKKE